MSAPPAGATWLIFKTGGYRRDFLDVVYHHALQTRFALTVTAITIRAITKLRQRRLSMPVHCVGAGSSPPICSGLILRHHGKRGSNFSGTDVLLFWKFAKRYWRRNLSNFGVEHFATLLKSFTRLLVTSARLGSKWCNRLAVACSMVRNIRISRGATKEFAGTTGTASTANPVHVRFRIVWYVVVNHVADTGTSMPRAATSVAMTISSAPDFN